MKAPKYYLSVFGNPEPPNKDTIESGLYHPDLRFGPFPTEPGDFLLLYCTAGYSEHAMEVPGIGVVLETKETYIYYRYLPFTMAISKSELDSKFNQRDKIKFSNIRFSSHWLFEISRESFLNVVADRKILWP
jgi:hypothetical protein